MEGRAMTFALRRRDVWDPFQVLWQDGGSLLEQPWAMPLDVYETKDRVVVKADVPGLKPEDLDVSVTGTLVTIRGERKHEQETREANFYRREVAYGTFQRQIELPHTVNADELKATYKQGILELSFPKKEEAKPKQIKVQAE